MRFVRTAILSSRLIMLLIIVVISAAICRSLYERDQSHEVRMMMQVAMDDIAKRVRVTSHNLKTITALNNASALAKTRAFARMVASDKTLLGDQKRLEDICKILDVDEVHVSDRKGILIACVPKIYVGTDMTQSDQTRAFLPAITNANFELAQEPMQKGLAVDERIDKIYFQYAGVARIDEPGIVQVGQRAERVREAKKLADVEEIAKSSRSGYDGEVSIVSNRGLPPARKGFSVDEGEDGEEQLVLERDCENWRIQIRDDEPASWIADQLSLVIFSAFDALMLGLFLVLHVISRKRLADSTKTISEVFKGHGRSGFVMRTIKSPITVVALLVLAISVSVVLLVNLAESRKAAKEILAAAIDDMSGTIDDCVDDLLFYQGESICKHYRTPEAMTETAVEEVMRQYNIDELNVVNSRGIVIMGAIADRGYAMSSHPKTAEFNRLLEGNIMTYSQAFRGAVENPLLRRKYVGVAFPPPAQGYIQIGFDERRLKDGIDYWFQNAATGWHVGDSGFFVIAKEETGEIDSCGLMLDDGNGMMAPVLTRGDTLASIGFDVAAAPQDSRRFFEAKLYGVKCLCLTDVRCYHRIICAIPLSEVRMGAIDSLIWVIVVLSLVFALVVVFMSRLSDLVASLREEKIATAEAQHRELAAARTIQMSSLPAIVPSTKDFAIYPMMQTAKEVGGDFYDFYTLPSGRKFVMIADVSGKGISAAMFMMKAKAIIKSCMFECDEMQEAVSQANIRLSESNEAEMFVTCWMAAINVKNGEVEFVNAGHNPPLVKRSNGKVEWIRTRPSLVLAAMSGVKYRVEKMLLEPGDQLFLYTDGVTEAMNDAGDLFGEKRLETIFAESKDRIVETTLQKIHEFVKGAEQSDDITMLSFDFRPRI